MSKVDLRNGSSLKNDVWEESISQNTRQPNKSCRAQQLISS